MIIIICPSIKLQIAADIFKSSVPWESLTKPMPFKHRIGVLDYSATKQAINRKKHSSNSKNQIFLVWVFQFFDAREYWTTVHFVSPYLFMALNKAEKRHHLLEVQLPIFFQLYAFHAFPTVQIMYITLLHKIVISITNQTCSLSLQIHPFSMKSFDHVCSVRNGIHPVV